MCTFPIKFHLRGCCVTKKQISKWRWKRMCATPNTRKLEEKDDLEN